MQVGGWIEERLAVAEKLPVGFIKVFLFAFVFPREAAALPDIGKTALAFGFFRGAATLLEREKLGVFNDPLLKAECFAARWIGANRGGLPEQGAEIVEMLLIGRGFFAGIFCPFPFEFCGCHRACVT